MPLYQLLAADIRVYSCKSPMSLFSHPASWFSNSTLIVHLHCKICRPTSSVNVERGHRERCRYIALRLALTSQSLYNVWPGKIYNFIAITFGLISLCCADQATNCATVLSADSVQCHVHVDEHIDYLTL